MTTHAEFRRAAWRHWGHHLARCAGIFALGAFVFAVLWLILAVVDPAESPEMRAEIALAVAIAVGLATALLYARSLGSDAREDARLICPQCDSPLGYYYVMLVLSSGNCPHCGERVLEGDVGMGPTGQQRG
jgi:hypothetical protein